MEDNESRSGSKRPESSHSWLAIPLPENDPEQMEFWPLQTLRTKIARFWRTRHRHFRRRFLVGFTTAIILGLATWYLAHWKDPDRDYKITNFVAAFFPFPASVFIAFLPDMERSEKMRPLWRIVIVACGLVYSLILWHQQSVNLVSSRRDQASIVNSAVNQANEHTDKQIEGVHKDVGGMQSDVASIKENLVTTSKELGDRSTASEKQIGELETKFSTALSQTETSLGKAIGNIVLPPGKVVSLAFSFWDQEALSKNIFPVKTATVIPDSTGVFSVPFIMRNVSSAGFRDGDIWMDVCSSCTFAEEPPGFEKLEGQDEHIRHRTATINPGVTVVKQTVKIKLNESAPNFFQLGFRYSCDACAEVNRSTAQILTVSVGKAIQKSGGGTEPKGQKD